MDNAFLTLGLEPALQLDDDRLREQFREAGKSRHPDAGGGAEDFADLREAHAVLASPSRRLRHWLELRGLPAETRGAVDERLMDLFSVIGSATQAAEALGRRREAAKSALVRAMMEAETQSCREQVEAALAQLEVAVQRELAAFPDIEAGRHGEPAKVARNLAFLEKWQAGLRAQFAKLI